MNKEKLKQVVFEYLNQFQGAKVWTLTHPSVSSRVIANRASKTSQSIVVCGRAVRDEECKLADVERITTWPCNSMSC